jgi:S1-C subfamily serine protease
MFFGVGSSHAQTAQEVAKKAFASTVLLVMEDGNGQPLSLGSGFFVRNGEIASNLHVVEGAVRGYAKLVGEKTKYDIEGIAAVDAERDLVVLKISAGRSQALPVGNSDVVQVGESVYAVGNPQGLEGTFSQGIVSSIREVGTDKLLQITAPISPGSSGGPVLNGKGEVIGVSVATFRGGQNLNFAIPSNYLKALLATAGTAGSVKPLSQAKIARAQKSMFADIGGRSSDSVVGTSFTYDSMIGDYSFSLVNKLREPVRDVYCLIVFYDKDGSPLDVQGIRYSDVIPDGLAKRITSKVDPSVQRLNMQRLSTNEDRRPGIELPGLFPPPYLPGSKIEFRVLDFDIVK